ncbi:sulfur carrier protein ThiS [Neisseria leonii]|uniref:Sulfur carrier protein ThiS n=1 Tax=Neisseria leonii TaxID=2995413 RepID=A0A9X4IDQ8_9NEIS|nr:MULTISPECIES: sulfur carrier protein ThiS [unclassified Neisseria]MDD9325071.1 sulfur carrier protein ThiS [Neisseria sp. 3986]MDD9327388.1 sulfur carrier protein ThiS [Neisseria sp. 51.81]
MSITLNGQTTTFCGGTLADLIAQTEPQQPFAVALNTAFVPKTAYTETRLQNGDAVEIVRPVVGG